MWKSIPEKPVPVNYDPGITPNTFIGKIGAIGTQASGKTRALMAVANFTSRKSIYSWDEDDNIAGTISVQPFTVDFSNIARRVVLVDNHGQNSLESLRISVAKSGETYRGLIVFIDSIGWNFSNVSLWQTKNLSDALGNPELPILLLITKTDLIKTLIKKEIIDEIAHAIVTSVNTLKQGDKIPYYNRIKNKVEWIVYNPEGELVPFTVLEQVFVNAVDSYLRTNIENGLSKINSRILVRSLLLAYADLIKSWIQNIPEYSMKYSTIKFSDNLILSLNYYRPTSIETEISWSKIVPASNEIEPMFPLSTFSYERILDTFKRNTIIPLDHALEDIVEKAKSILPVNCKIITTVAVDTISNEGIKNLVENIEKFVSTIKTEKSDTRNVSPYVKAIPPPPKPKRL